MTDQKKMSRREIATSVISGAILIAAVVYWIIQIDGVMEMMKLARGG
jgi:hypothetical protein